MQPLHKDMQEVLYIPLSYRHFPIFSLYISLWLYISLYLLYISLFYISLTFYVSLSLSISLSLKASFMCLWVVGNTYYFSLSHLLFLPLSLSVGQFHQRSMYSFYARRSQKRKKILTTWLRSYALGSYVRKSFT